MKKITAVFAVTLVVSVGTVQAQQSPLSGLFNNIKSLGSSIQSIGQSASPTASASAASPDVGLPQSPLVGILQLYAQDAATQGFDEHQACSPNSLSTTDSMIRGGEAQFKLGNFSTASGALKLGAEAIASCAVGPNDIPANLQGAHWQRVPLDAAISQVGRALAFSALAAQRANIVTSVTITDANNAMQLLQSDPQANNATINQLKASGLAVTAIGAETGNTVTTMMAADAVARYKANNFGFNSKYSGKKLQIRGQVQAIGGAGASAIITLLGYMPKNPQDQGFQDVVRCDVVDPTALQRVENLSKGQMTSVIGLYNPATSALQVGIELQSCSVVP